MLDPMKDHVTTRPAVLPTQVLCVDDNSEMTLVLRLMINAEPMMRCVGCLGSADHLLRRVRGLDPPPDVVVLDAMMPGKDALEAMGEMTAEFPAIRTIVYSGHDDPGFLERMRGAGAWGCVSKREEPDTILRAVREVAAGRTWWPKSARGG
jgi:DNA-binding NarL/FixJ family response regulator